MFCHNSQETRNPWKIRGWLREIRKSRFGEISSGSGYCFPYALLEFVQEPQRKRILLLTICPPQAEIFWGCTHRFEELRRIWRSKSVWKWRKTTRESSKKRDFFPRRLTAPLRVQKNYWFWIKFRREAAKFFWDVRACHQLTTLSFPDPEKNNNKTSWRG